MRLSDKDPAKLKDKTALTSKKYDNAIQKTESLTILHQNLHFWTQGVRSYPLLAQLMLKLVEIWLTFTITSAEDLFSNTSDDFETKDNENLKQILP